MEVRDRLVAEDGRCKASDSCDRQANEYYRLYHFLNDVEEILKKEPDDRRRLEFICFLVRRLLMSSYWLQSAARQPDPNTGWSVLKLYDEPSFPFSVQNSVWLPGQISPIHNHATWGVVALISGQEKNTFWQRLPNSTIDRGVEKIGEQILNRGDIIGFLPDTIHSIEVLGDEPAISFNIYGAATGEIIYFNAVNTCDIKCDRL